MAPSTSTLLPDSERVGEGLQDRSGTGVDAVDGGHRPLPVNLKELEQQSRQFGGRGAVTAKQIGPARGGLQRTAPLQGSQVGGESLRGGLDLPSKVGGGSTPVRILPRAGGGSPTDRQSRRSRPGNARPLRGKDPPRRFPPVGPSRPGSNASFPGARYSPPPLPGPAIPSPRAGALATVTVFFQICFLTGLFRWSRGVVNE